MSDDLIEMEFSAKFVKEIDVNRLMWCAGVDFVALDFVVTPVSLWEKLRAVENFLECVELLK